MISGNLTRIVFNDLCKDMRDYNTNDTSQPPEPTRASGIGSFEEDYDIPVNMTGFKWSSPVKLKVILQFLS